MVCASTKFNADFDAEFCHKNQLNLFARLRLDCIFNRFFKPAGALDLI